MTYLLQCPRCRNKTVWTRESNPEGPGVCECGAYSPWNVILDKECPICGNYHSEWIECDGDPDYPPRDWGDL